MKPTSGGKARLIIIGKKRLPDPARHERFFGYVGEHLSFMLANACNVFFMFLMKLLFWQILQYFQAFHM